MTRDEALKKAEASCGDPGNYLPPHELVVNILEALGLIRFEPPKDNVWRLAGAINRQNRPMQSVNVHELKKALADASLELVEKQ